MKSTKRGLQCISILLRYRQPGFLPCFRQINNWFQVSSFKFQVWNLNKTLTKNIMKQRNLEQGRKIISFKDSMEHTAPFPPTLGRTSLRERYFRSKCKETIVMFSDNLRDKIWRLLVNPTIATIRGKDQSKRQGPQT